MSCFIAQAGFEFAILLPWHPKRWDYGYVPSLPALDINLFMLLLF
jgi:hypothetical protein